MADYGTGRSNIEFLARQTVYMKVQKKEEPSELQSWSGREGPMRKDHGPLTIT